MKKIIALLVLLPLLAFGWGGKPATSTTITSGSLEITNFADQENVVRDSITVTTITNIDTIDTDQVTVFGNTKGIMRLGLVPDVATVDSVYVLARFMHGTFAMTRWFPVYMDTVQTDTSATAFVAALDLGPLVAGATYWGLFYDPSGTTPMDFVPKAGDHMQIRIAHRKTGATVVYTMFIVWQEN